MEPVDTKHFLFTLKEQLADFCQTINNDLNNKTPPIGKYLDVQPNNQTQPDPQDQTKRENFLANKKVDSNDPTFNEFFDKLSTVLSKITHKDMDSIGLGKETEAAKEFSQCFDILNEACFYNVNGKPINFWSGPEAKKEADETTSSLSNSNVPALAVIIKAGMLLQELGSNKTDTIDPELKGVCNNISDLIYGGASGVFASQATDKVSVYMSAYNANEQMSMVEGNFHWNAELPILQSSGVEIDVIYFNHESTKDSTVKPWQDPIDFNDKSTDKMINIVRRDSYKATALPKEEADKLKDKNPEAYTIRPYNESAEDRAKWIEEGQARTSTTLHKLREVGDKWKHAALSGQKEYHEARENLWELKKELKHPMPQEKKQQCETQISELVGHITNYIDKTIKENRKFNNAQVAPKIEATTPSVEHATTSMKK